MIVKILIFILIFFVVVLSHEFGHFIVAKANGISVVEFSIGMGPKLFGFKRKGTLYALRLLPLGGACLFDDEDVVEKQLGDEHVIDSEQAQAIAREPVLVSDLGSGKKKFSEASVFARLTTTLAGPIFNFFLAYLLALIIVSLSGSTDTKLTGILDGYPAQEAGLLVGDEIISINGERTYLYDEVSMISQLYSDGELTIKVKRGTEKISVTVTPKYDEEAGRYYIGFTGGNLREKNAGTVLIGAFFEVRYWIKMTIKSLVMLFTGKASAQDISGPIGVADVVSEVYDEAAAFGILTIIASMLNIAVLLSANLGVINLLPLPALDGGRILFQLIELITGKRVPKEKEAIVHFIGFVLLMALMVFVFYNDIMRIVRR